jgi:hypothetical protein
MLSLPYTGYAHAILCWCFILAYSDSNTQHERLRPNSHGTSSEYKEGYTADRIVIIARDWFVQKSGKVPSDVCLKVNAFLNNYISLERFLLSSSVSCILML